MKVTGYFGVKKKKVFETFKSSKHSDRKRPQSFYKYTDFTMLRFDNFLRFLSQYFNIKKNLYSLNQLEEFLM